MGELICIFSISRAEGVLKLVPEEDSRYYLRVQHYRELLDSLQMDAYTHGCILHPEITVDSHIPTYAATSIRSKDVEMCSMFKTSWDSPHIAKQICREIFILKLIFVVIL